MRPKANIEPRSLEIPGPRLSPAGDISAIDRTASIRCLDIGHGDLPCSYLLLGKEEQANQRGAADLQERHTDTLAQKGLYVLQNKQMVTPNGLAGCLGPDPFFWTNPCCGGQHVRVPTAPVWWSKLKLALRSNSTSATYSYSHSCTLTLVHV